MSGNVGLFATRVQINRLPLVHGTYTLGLYLVTGDFCCNLLELKDFKVGVHKSTHRYVGYPASSCGVVVLDAFVSPKLR